MLNAKNEKELFCAVLTHCDAHEENEDGEAVILNKIEEQGFGRLETHDERDGGHQIYENGF
jgi:hypothetical protein